MFSKMKFSIIFLVVIAISLADDSKDLEKDEPKPKKEEETIEDIIKQFETKAAKTAEAIANNTKDVIELAKESVKEGVTKAEDAAKTLLKDGEDFIDKFNKIQSKLDASLEECNDKFMGEKSVLGKLLINKKELKELAEELLKCPTDNIKGMGCTLGKLMRGEAMMEEVSRLLKAQKGSAKEQADALVEQVEKCNQDVLKIATDAVKELLSESKKCSIKDEL